MPSLVELGQAFRQQRQTPTQAVEECLSRIRAHDQTLRAWVLVDEEQALADARRLEAELAAGDDRGPLHGIPLGIKDIIDVAGWPTLAGSRIRSGEPAGRDAEVIARLRHAGAIFVGKTVTTEFACFDPPPTKNPFHLAHTPGGSSSGSAAAVAVGMCLGALGSQTGGSITRPASYCGIAGLKPTLGRVSTEGVVPVSFTLDHVGPMARHVADVALLARAMVEPTPTSPLAASWEAIAPLETLTAHAQDPPRLGLLEDFLDELNALAEEADTPEAARKHREAAEAVQQAADKCTAAGATVERVRLAAPLAEVLAMHRRLMAAEAAWYHRSDFAARREEYGPNLTSLLDEGLALRAVDYAEALFYRQQTCREMARIIDLFDALLLPATTQAAPGAETTGDPRCNAPWSFTGLPAVSFPCAYSSEGLPLAVQLVAGWGEENKLLSAGLWCERQAGELREPDW